MPTLLALESKARKHWNQFLPSMVASLKAEGRYEASLRRVAFAAQQEIRELVRSGGYQEHEAEEVVLPALILLKPEVDAGPAWERDELAEMEAQYQAMMRPMTNDQ